MRRCLLCTISFLFGLLLLLNLSCSNKEGKSERTDSERLARLLPSSGEVKGWERSSKPRFYQTDNLYEYINGAADGYILYGFKEVVTADYSDSENREIVIDIYQMKDLANAFGIYSTERSPTYNFVQIGAEGYLGEANLNFWKDKYYVKMVTFKSSKGLRDAMMSLGKVISTKIPGEPKQPEFLGFLPEENYVHKSVVYIPKDVLGQSFLSNGYVADYKIDGRECKLFLIDSPDEEGAKKAFQSYKSFIADKGKLISEAKLAQESFIGEDSFYGRTIVFRMGDVMGGVLGAPDDESGKRILKEVLRRIKRP